MIFGIKLWLFIFALEMSASTEDYMLDKLSKMLDLKLAANNVLLASQIEPTLQDLFFKLEKCLLRSRS